jgi:hypothetical protein
LPLDSRWYRDGIASDSLPHTSPASLQTIESEKDFKAVRAPASGMIATQAGAARLVG